MGHDRIGLDDNFFSLGGTSLLGMRYIARINDVYNVRFGAVDLTRAPTVASMAQLITGRLTGGANAEQSEAEGRLNSPIGRKLWRPPPDGRAEGSFDEIDAAAIAYLPDDLLEAARHIEVNGSVLRQLPRADDPQWGAVCRLPLGTIAVSWSYRASGST